MKSWIRSWAAVLVIGVMAAGAVGATGAQQNNCLMFVTRNISNPGPNFYLYEAFTRKLVAFRKGDVLEYDIYLAKSNPEPCGGIDVETLSNSLRDSNVADQNQVGAHPNTHLPQAVGKWYHRVIPLDALAGQRSHTWTVVSEGDARGTYIQFFDHIFVKHADGTRTSLWDGGEPTMHQIIRKEGYSKAVVLEPVARSAVTNNVDLSAFVDKQVKQFALHARLDEMHDEMELAGKVAGQINDSEFSDRVADAEGRIKSAEENSDLNDAQVQDVLDAIKRLLHHDEPIMQQYTAHLVGHAHIDFQWLWEWPETVQVCRDTFKSALNFMHEFAGFKFSQSSAGLYSATEKSWPSIFKGIQDEVAAGNWEIVGGRITEGDENMISPESHASSFLYGQRYFREHFKGKDAVVGWEPDTFGHTWQFPQLLQLAGCKYFYFCRAGYNLPLFWWQAPDGTRVLAFEQTANGGWYNGDITAQRLDDQFNFQKATGSKDMLWVYGVGNHGGGPTRENINSALEYQKLPFLPKIEFSTATAFFESLGKYDLSKLPVQATDLNTAKACGFNGVWTSHSDVKRWNRDAEAITESAEAIAYFASRYGYPYPADELKKNWTDICWNHHHDTISGTAFHNSYYRTGPIFERVIASSREIAQDALSFLACRVQSDSDGIMVFNPCGWTRSDIATFGENVTADSDAVSAEDREPMQNTADGKSIFLVKDIPAYSYRVYHIQPRTAGEQTARIAVSDNNRSLENADYKVTLNGVGGISSLFDKHLNRESIAKGGDGNRLEIHWENPRDSSAWVIGKIDRVETLKASSSPAIEEDGPSRMTLAWDYHFKSTLLHETMSLGQSGPPVFTLSTQWNEVGGVDRHEPFLKVAFDLAVDHPAATYQIPFATIEKPIDGEERPASKFADFSGGGFGAALLNDCKQGYSAKGNTLLLSLIRSAYFPDPHPNDRPQHASWILFPHAGDGEAPQITQAAEAFNHPLLVTAFHPLPGASLPHAMTFLTVNQPNVFITAVKRAEDDHDMIVRCYELDGKATSATFTLPDKPGKIQTVNLIEDPLHPETSPTIHLRGHEIRTLKIAIPPAQGFENTN